jgi:hypothetical protein
MGQHRAAGRDIIAALQPDGGLLWVPIRRRARDPRVTIFARKDAEMGESKVARLGKKN